MFLVVGFMGLSVLKYIVLEAKRALRNGCRCCFSDRGCELQQSLIDAVISNSAIKQRRLSCVCLLFVDKLDLTIISGKS